MTHSELAKRTMIAMQKTEAYGRQVRAEGHFALLSLPDFEKNFKDYARAYAQNYNLVYEACLLSKSLEDSDCALFTVCIDSVKALKPKQANKLRKELDRPEYTPTIEIMDTYKEE